ncbi:hypothetical protein [Streptomyces sp. NPDC005423]|uniref:hypothetical protein n=1 Tax=Streptomyces sp. NPDC005423 TaxID=3155343 RepID=UPI0033A31315
MNHFGPPLSPAAPSPPSPYRADGLIPPAGAARTWGLTVIGVPLLVLLLLSLVGGGFGGESGTAGIGSGSSGGSGSSSSSDGSGIGSGSGGLEQPWASAASSTGTEVPDPYGTSSATPGPYGTVSVTPDPYGASGTAGPREVVVGYFAAINKRDFGTAWELGGKNLDADYTSFASGFATTLRDTVSHVSVRGDVVRLVLNARQTDGSSRSYSATYTVHDGVITAGSATPIT